MPGAFNTQPMIRNYLKIALRIFWQNKTYVLINLLSLGFALACCILSYLHYHYRHSFDKNHVATENIYRLNSVRKVGGGGIQRWGLSPSPVAATLEKDLPGISRTARLFSENLVVKKEESVFNETVHYADKNIFSFFTFPLKEGDYSGFESKNNLIISEAFAFKYFGKKTPVGNTVMMIKNGKEELFTVIGVLERLPLNSSFQFDLVTSFNNAFINASTLNDWRDAPLITTFAEIKNKTAAQNLSRSLDQYVGVHNESQKNWLVKSFYFQPFTEIALSSDVDFDEFVEGRALKPNPRGVMVFVPAIMSLFILLITCFNFTNISIAFASKRLKEIGVRKVMGGRKSQLVKQFLTENILLCLIASMVAIVIVLSLLPLFKNWTGVALEFNVIHNPVLLVFLLLLPIITALIAGIYPSFYISSFEPIGILKGSTTFGPKSRFTRFLLLVQFSLSCLALVIGIVLTKNASFQDKVDFGYAINEVVVTQLDSAGDYTALRNALLADTRVKGIGGAAQQVGAGTRTVTASNEKTEVKAQLAQIEGEDYLRTMGIQLVAGRHFHKGNGPDKDESVIINQTFAKQLNISEPIGKQVVLDSISYTIIGMVKDYKENGLHGQVPPCVLRAATEDEFKYMAIRATEENVLQIQNAVKAAWYKVLPGKPYRGFLQSDMVEKERYLNTGFQAVSFFMAAITILLSAAGLFALVSLNIIRRSKEVGMRKVLGASTVNLMSIVSKDFFYIIFLAFLIGASLGYVIIDKIIFRHIYAYHTEIGVGAFIAALAIIVLSCCATVGWRVYNAAVSNPINVLRKD